MPEYYPYYVKLTDARAAEIIVKSFPRGWKRILKREKCFFGVHFLCDALLHARIKCGSESTEKCIEWAYEQIKK